MEAAPALLQGAIGYLLHDNRPAIVPPTYYFGRHGNRAAGAVGWPQGVVIGQGYELCDCFAILGPSSAVNLNLVELIAPG